MLLVTPALAAPPTTALLGTPPQPGWSLLSTEQKIILAPLAKDWDEMDNIRRKKWLGITERFPRMTTEEQNRVQERMHEWAGMPADKRAKIRDSYKEFQQLPPERKLAVKQKWEQYYSALTDEEKQRIREGGRIARPTPPRATGTPPTMATIADTQSRGRAPETTRQ